MKRSGDFAKQLHEYLATRGVSEADAVSIYQLRPGDERSAVLERDVGARAMAQRVLYASRIRTLAQETIRIAEVFEKAGIRIISLKGVPLADELYDDSDQRGCGDIDLFVGVDDIVDSLGILHTLGYRSQFQPNIPLGEVLRHMGASLAGLKHFMCVKQPESTRSTQTVELDLHVNLLEGAVYPLVDYDRFLRRARRHMFRGTCLWRLDVNDELLFLLLHLARTITFRYESKLYTTKDEKQLKLPLVLDIALYIEKYRTMIDWEYVTTSALDYGLFAELGIALRIVQEIFGCIECRMVEDLLSAPCILKHSSLQERITREISFLQAEKIILELLRPDT